METLQSTALKLKQLEHEGETEKESEFERIKQAEIEGLKTEAKNLFIDQLGKYPNARKEFIDGVVERFIEVELRHGQVNDIDRLHEFFSDIKNGFAPDADLRYKNYGIPVSEKAGLGRGLALRHLLGRYGSLGVLHHIPTFMGRGHYQEREKVAGVIREYAPVYNFIIANCEGLKKAGRERAIRDVVGEFSDEELNEQLQHYNCSFEKRSQNEGALVSTGVTDKEKQAIMADFIVTRTKVEGLTQ